MVAEIARGGASIVWRARQLTVNRTVALKLLRTPELLRPDEAKRFRIEAAAVASLQHPSIVPLHDFGEHDGQPWISMAFIPGPTLGQRIREQRFSAEQAAILLKTIAEAIAYAHSRGILHRDIKPSNILLDDQGQPYVTDFGLAKRFAVEPQVATHESQLTLTGQLLGTPNYSPPEQLAVRRGALGPHSDVYSLGAVLYEMLTGRPPFDAATVEATLLQVIDADPISPRSFNSAAPLDLETICLKCLEKQPARRYATAQDLIAELDRFLQGEPISARPIGMFGRLGRWCRRNPGWATSGALALVLAATLCAAIVSQRFDQKERTALTPHSGAIPVALRNPTATFSQTFQAPWLVNAAVDGNNSSGGWSIYNFSEFSDQTLPQIAVFRIASEIGYAGGSLLTFTLVQNGGNKLTLGRFRLSATTDVYGSFADYAHTGGDVTANWTILDPISFTSSNGATLTKLRDRSILASDSSPDVDTYTVTAPTSLIAITGVRLEVLADSSLPAHGPGRQPATGNFILTELELGISPATNKIGNSSIFRDQPMTPAVTFVDAEFLDSNWDLISFTDPSQVTPHKTQITDASGNPGSFQRITHALGGAPGPSAALSVHLNKNASYDPRTQGAIDSIDYAEDARTFSTEYNTYGGGSMIALRQNELIFTTFAFQQPVRDDNKSRDLPSPWKEIRLFGLRQADFALVKDVTSYDLLRNPDFSTNGAPIVFGFARSNTHTFSDKHIRQSDIDNWGISVYTHSESP